MIVQRLHDAVERRLIAHADHRSSDCSERTIETCAAYWASRLEGIHDRHSGPALQVPADMAVNMALPTITTAVRGNRVVRVLPDWTEIIALATVTASPSAERKSATHRVVVAPLKAHEAEQQRLKRPEIAKQRARRDLAQDRVDVLRKAAVKSGETADEGKFLYAVHRLSEITVDPLPRWVAADITPESIVKLLAAHGAVGVLSAEPGLFAILRGRYSGGRANVETVLLATSGDSIIVDRVSDLRN